MKQCLQTSGNRRLRSACTSIDVQAEQCLPVCKYNQEIQALDLFVHVALLFYVHGKHLRSCRDGQLT